MQRSNAVILCTGEVRCAVQSFAVIENAVIEPVDCRYTEKLCLAFMTLVFQPAAKDLSTCSPLTGPGRQASEDEFSAPGVRSFYKTRCVCSLTAVPTQRVRWMNASLCVFFLATHKLVWVSRREVSL
ncbi:MAG: hypothetical protein CMM07_05830 [Rhodopirellula sp.]|nr:hypothetical protein [Rhodopirellula sp.]